MQFIKHIDWEATEEKHEAAFWDWCLGEGYYDEDYILDNFTDLFLSFVETLDAQEIVYEPATIPG